MLARRARQFGESLSLRELNEEVLLDSWRLLRKDAALVVDRVSAAEYEAILLTLKRH